MFNWIAIWWVTWNPLSKWFNELDQQRYLDMLCYSDVVPHEVKDLNHKTAASFKIVQIHVGVHNFGVFPQNSDIWMMQLKTWLIGSHTFFPTLDCPVLAFPCKLQTFYLVNIRQGEGFMEFMTILYELEINVGQYQFMNYSFWIQPKDAFN